MGGKILVRVREPDRPRLHDKNVPYRFFVAMSRRAFDPLCIAAPALVMGM